MSATKDAFYKDIKWQEIARDFNSPFFRNYIWTLSPKLFPTLFQIPAPIIGIFSEENVIRYIADMKSWTAAHEALKEKVLADFTVVEKIIDDTNSWGESFNVWSFENIFQKDLEKPKPGELIKLLEEFIERQAKLYSYGITLPVLDFLGYAFVEKSIEKILRSKVSEAEYKHYFDLFTYPLHNSFAQDQEEALLGLMDEFMDDEWKNDVLKMTSKEIEKKYPEFHKKLAEHTKKFAWVYYVYAGPAFTEKHFHDFIKDYLKKNIDPKSKLAELKQKQESMGQLREETLKKFGLESKDESFLRLAGKMVWAKPRRKDYQSRSYFHLERLHRELARRTSLSLSQIRSAPIETIAAALESGEVDVSPINSIYKIHVCLPSRDGIIVLSGDEAKEFNDKCVIKETEDNKNVTEITGNTASPGVKRGKVKIINRPEDMYKMEDGDVLVSVATTPSIVPAMKKAVAIVTDEGGLTCHAAIVSRELGITCVIGTKNATKVLKDGDMVEVDAEKGVVKILK